MPLVSFCLSTFKRGEILMSTLKSILRQTFTDYEVIVSDNDPEESGRSTVIGINDLRFKYFANGENLGMKRSFNRSVDRSSGTYIVMMADDDPIYFDMLDTIIRLSIDFPGHGMYLGGCDWLCTNTEMAALYNLKIGTNSCLSNELELDDIKAFSANEFLVNFFSFKIFPHCLWSTCMVRKQVIMEKGGIPEYGTPFLGDYAYLSVMASDSGCVIINKALGCQTLHKENFGRNQNEQLIIAARNFPEYVGERLQYLPSWRLIKKQMYDFVGLWIVSHMSFLYQYFKKENRYPLGKVEKDIFQIEYLKRFKIKYFLKSRLPKVHDQLVLAKKKLK